MASQIRPHSLPGYRPPPRRRAGPGLRASLRSALPGTTAVRVVPLSAQRVPRTPLPANFLAHGDPQVLCPPQRLHYRPECSLTASSSFAISLS